MSKSRSFLSILIPSATVFLSSGCIMILELVAGRLIARHLGSSLYTWTSVIGVVLAGITIGNYLGGRIADKFHARKALATLFVASSAACVLTIILNNLVSEWLWLWRLDWPIRVFSHVSMVFFIPSTLLGTISPVVAKMALDQGLPTGRTVGDIYAWGAAGSIVGTFITGFYLIAAIGTVAIIWAIGAVLLLMAILYWARLWLLYVWAAIFIASFAMGTVPVEWVKEASANLALREKPNPKIIYEDESQYCYIAVKSLAGRGDRRAFMQDKLMHSEIVMGNILSLQYSYEQIYAALTRLMSHEKDKLSVLVIGGGGYVFPRYVEKVWPGSRVDVAEIDYGVTEAAMQAFGLERNTSINTFTMDARNYVDELLEKKRNNKETPLYDFIYEDALSDYSIPYQLATKEFNDKIAQILKDDGAYMIELIDVYDSGLFVGAFINTLEQTFPYVNVVTEMMPASTRNTFVIVATKQKINFENLTSQSPVRHLDLWILDDSDIEELRKKPNEIVLTDNYAPVENLLAPVVRQGAIDLLVARYIEQAKKLRIKGKWRESIAIYKTIISIDPLLSVIIYNDMAMVYGENGKWQEAADVLYKALDYNDKSDHKDSMSNMHYNLGIALKNLGKTEQASEHLHKAVQGYKEDLLVVPDSLKAETILRLGNALMEIGDFSQATKYFQQLVNMEPYNAENHTLLVQSLVRQQRYDEAIKALKAADTFMKRAGMKKTAAELRQYLEFLEFKKSKHEK